MKMLLLLLGGIQILDGVVTHWGVTTGIVREANPIVASVAGSGHFVILKVVGAVACAVALWLVHRRFPKVALAGANGVLAFYGIVLIWNSYVLL